MPKTKVLKILFPSFIESLVARDMLDIPDSLVGNTDQTPLQLCSSLDNRYYFEGVGNAGKKKLQGTRLSLTLLPVDWGGRMAGVLFIMPSKASSKKKEEEGFIFGDILSRHRINELKRLGVQQMGCHVVVTQNQERTVVSFLPSSNGWHQGHNMPETCKFFAKTKYLACKVLGLSQDTVALLTADSW